jgi:predicted dehydrogenase
MGKAHAYGYTAAPAIRTLPVTPRLRVISGRDVNAVQRAAAAYGFDEWSGDWREVVERRDVDLVDICTPPGTHAEIAAAAAASGKAVLTEKPLATSYAAGLSAARAVERAGVLNAVGFNYRRLPAVSLMKRMIEEGMVGEVRHFRATWLSDEFCDPSIPFDWRFDRAMGGTTILDLGCHLVDMALWMVGELRSVSAQSATFTTLRPGASGGELPVDVDDAAAALARFSSGATAVFEVSRTCPRRPCDFTVEINGSRGTLVFDYRRLNELSFGDGSEAGALYGMRTIRAEHPSHPYAGDWWPIGQGVGYGSSFVNQVSDLLASWPDGPWKPDFRAGLAVQAVCEAMERSVAEGRWVDVSEVVPAP